MIGKLKTIVYADLFNKPIKFLLLRNSAYLLPKQVMGYDVPYAYKNSTPAR